MKHCYDLKAAGAKTLWIIEFARAETALGKPPIHFLIPYPPNSPEREANLWLDTGELKDFEKKFHRFLGVVGDLCNTFDEACKKNIGQGSYSESVKENAENLSNFLF